VRAPLVRVPRTVVLVPAHDEEDCLPAALRTLEPELGEGDRIVVVAHNCSDRTAMVARARGAEVVEARDAGTGGKPDALKAGLRALDVDPPEVVVIIDADCRVMPGSIRTLAMAAAASGGPVQGDDLRCPRARIGRIAHAAAMVQDEHGRDRLPFARFADAERVDTDVGLLSLANDVG